jgi:hypothetical protein
MYHMMVIKTSITKNKDLPKLKLDQKINIFLRYIGKGVILTKDNLPKKNCKGSTQCCFCNQSDNIRHLFFDCYIAQVVCVLFALR